MVAPLLGREIPSQIAFNLNELLHLHVPVRRRVEDWRLGAVALLCNAVFFAYVVGYQIIWCRGYLATDASVAGIVSTSIADPAEVMLPASAVAPDYCDLAAARAVGEASGTYSDPRNPRLRYAQLQCRWDWDAHAALYPAHEEGALTVTTRVTTFEERVDASACDLSSAASRAPCGFCVWCPSENRCCSVDDVNAGRAGAAGYVPQAEYFLVRVRHSLHPSALAGHGPAADPSSRSMSGEIRDAEGRRLDPCDDYGAERETSPPRHGQCPAAVALGEPGREDVLPLRTLLRAAGVDLDAESGTTSGDDGSASDGSASMWHHVLEYTGLGGGAADALPRDGRLGSTVFGGGLAAAGRAGRAHASNRFAGLVLRVSIEYSNVHTSVFSTSKVHYVYRAAVVPDAGFNVQEIVRSGGGAVHARRTVVDRFGVRIVFEQTGRIVYWSAQALIMLMVEMYVLSCITYTVVDWFAVRYAGRLGIAYDPLPKAVRPGQAAAATEAGYGAAEGQGSG
jgi:hypothetical protein